MSLVAYGGAGPLMGAQVAAGLGMARVVVPAQPGTLCARGLLVSDLARDLSVTRILPLTADSAAALDAAFATMEVEGADWLTGLGVPPEDHRFGRQVEARYRGQSFEIAVEAAAFDTPATLRARFEDAHRAEQGYALPDRAVDAVTLRLKAASAPSHEGARKAQSTASAEPRPDRQIYIAGAWRLAAIHDREGLAPGTRIAGPAILEEMSATTVVPPGWTAEVLHEGTLILTPEAKS